MKIVKVSLKEHPYEIVIGQNILSKLGKKLKTFKMGGNAVIVTNPSIYKYCGKAVISSLKESDFDTKIFMIPDQEKSKSIKVAFGLIEKIASYDVMKKIFLIALGGGVVGDLAGFVASIYKRGVPYVQVPTSLLAQIDSAIGGKVAVDLPVGKNLVGAFYQPRLVWSDVAVLSTLPKRQIRNGLAEAVKYGAIYDKKFLDYIAKHYKQLLNFHPETLRDVVVRCSQIKSKIVMQDEKETKGLRTILNFGHTIGHAIEAAGRYNSYQHGEAIALGMRISADISYQMGMLSQADLKFLNRLLSNIGLPEKIKKVALAHIVRMMQHDKKFLTGKNRFVLAEALGHVRVVEDVPLKFVKRAILNYM